MTLGLRRILIVALLLLGATALRASAQPAPYHKWRTLKTEHFLLHVPAGLEREGRIVAATAESAYARLARELHPPRGPIDLVLSDDADYANGFANVQPYNRVVLLATPPLDNAGLRLSQDWYELLLTHELTHVFHLDRTRGVWRVAQALFGRGPFTFPNAYGPSWLTEGLAVYEESNLTAGGRLRDAQHEMFARSTALEGRFPRIHELSFGTSQFPVGDMAYAYGSLFIEHIARTRGDSTIRRFVDAQSAQLIPYWLDRSAEQGFGISFSRAYDRWRDSLQRNAGERRAPLPGWRELTTHGFYATSPRWVNDTTLVYTGTSGRETNAAYTITTSGVRTRLGRRDTHEASVPLASGGFLYADLDLAERAEIRSDLYREVNGSLTRLTHAARLLQPDVRRSDGAIVAVKVALGRSSLVLLDANARHEHTLRAAGEDETWSEPRWSPDGARIAVAHRRHGGVYSIEVIDVASGDARVVTEGAYLLSSPSWTSDGDAVLYISESEGSPQIAMRKTRTKSTSVPEIVLSSSQTGLFAAELSPNSRYLAAVTLRADGYHVGIAPVDSLAPRAGEPRDSSHARAPAHEAAGAYTKYSPWRTLLPRYWLPVAEQAPGRGVRLGATTTGSDAVGRHSYSAYLAIPTTGMFPVGALSYRYAGFRQPLLDVALSQDYTTERTLLSGGTTDFVGTLLKRTQDAQVATTFVRPRVRTSASVTIGAGVERRGFVTDPGEFLGQLDTTYNRTYLFDRVLAGASWTNVQRPARSISQEDGVSLALTMRERWRVDLGATTHSASAVGTAAGYKSLPFGGFAHHVLALRLAGGIEDRRAGASLEVGGTSGTTLDVLPGYTVGEGRRTFGVRGFPAASTYGTRAAAASLEYRAPLSLPSRGLGMFPLYVDKTALFFFADAGVAACPVNALYATICSPELRTAASDTVNGGVKVGPTLGSVGSELVLSTTLLDWDRPQEVRVGVAVPFSGRAAVGANVVSAYLAFGFSF